MMGYEGPGSYRLSFSLIPCPVARMNSLLI